MNPIRHLNENEAAKLMRNLFPDPDECQWYSLIFLRDYYPKAYHHLCVELQRLKAYHDARGVTP